MSYNKLSADPAALILGVIAFVIMILGFCCGIFVFISLVLGTVGLVLSIKSLRNYADNPREYSKNSQQNVYAAKIICLIAVILSSLYFIVIVIAVVVYQVGFSDLFNNKIKQIKNEKFSDSIFLEQNTEQKYSNDSLYIDSTFIDTIEREH